MGVRESRDRLWWVWMDNGADIGECGNAFQSAADSGNIEAMQPLLDEGADIQVQGGLYGNALQTTVPH